MKSVTEFPNHRLLQGLKTKSALAAEGKTPEEIEAALAESFKLEGEKVKYFVNALEVAGQNLEKLNRVVVLSLNEGESAPAKATKVDELYYVPQFIIPPAPPQTTKADPRARGGGDRNKKSGPKSSPWGLSPEEKAAKNAPKAAKPAKA